MEFDNNTITLRQNVRSVVTYGSGHWLSIPREYSKLNNVVKGSKFKVTILDNKIVYELME